MASPEPNWRLKLKLWGVRGSIPTPVVQNLGYGGNTPCLEIRLPDNHLFIFDAGSGIRELGLELANIHDPNRDIHMFFTHFHWDHIQGLPFFAPLYNQNCSINFYSTRYTADLRTSLAGQMYDPHFPVNFDMAPSKREYIDLGADPVTLQNLTVTPFQMNHPQGAAGYRIESGGAVIVYGSDREHGHQKLDLVLREYAQDADILIHDCQYTPQEYPDHKGWGHSTWQEAVDIARECNVKQLVLFHHEPNHTDQAITALWQEACLQFPNTVAAKEGWEVTV